MESMDEAPDATEEIEEQPSDKKECMFCENVVAIVGLLIGSFVAFVGLDLLSKGALTRMFTRSKPAEDDDE